MTQDAQETTIDNLPVDYEALLAAQREDLQSRLSAPAGDYIKVGTDKTFTFPNGDTTSEPFEAIVLDYQYLNVYYKGAFVRGQSNPALCFANGAKEDTMSAPDDVPEKQADTCNVCPNNQFGSSGNGKACKNRILIALLPPDATIDTPIHVLSVPPTAIKHFQKYMRTLTKTARKAPMEVVTKIGFNKDSTYAEPMFEPTSTVVGVRREFGLNPILALSLARKQEARERLEAEKPDTTERPQVARGATPVKRSTK